ncbi:putative Lactoylglutathione lyase Glo1 [Rhodotorula toruloides ATCC 204091]|uniref:Putative Lactoylglutathione lyase Glo1 n=1 Tax=Rhodotorula toruloides TaxID=5286 RepID=A0A0K3CJ90_RHOTO|nr:putative Lactoylglutathione lyase Glo1 [Rhodotorula toruloides ATCC 204091]PRQ72596.1 putative Lactoylglutathione lyase Glo1 [Rhodotorula toruloides]
MAVHYTSLAGEPGQHNVGNDAPRPAETKGIHLHHLCLRIKDPKITLPFFREVLGMRTLFTYNAGSFSMCVPVYLLLFGRSLTSTVDSYYMYHGDEGNDETEKVWADFPNQKGLVELIHRHGSENEDFSYASGHHPTEPAMSGFGHLGLIVDDVPALVQRAKKYGCKIIKEQGVSSAETVGWPNGTPQPIQAYNELYSNMAMIESPDGYWFECVPRVLEKH